MELKTLKVKVLRAWCEGDAESKKLLENIHGKEIFQNQDVTDRVKTIEDARAETGRPNIDFSFMPEDLRENAQAEYDAKVVVEALNEGWIPDWGNDNQRKWRPWFNMNDCSPASFSFCASDCIFSVADLGGGSRLCLKDERLSNYLAEQFPEICKKVQLK